MGSHNLPDIGDLLALVLGELEAAYGKLPSPQTQGCIYALMMEAVSRGYENRPDPHEEKTNPGFRRRRR